MKDEIVDACIHNDIEVLKRHEFDPNSFSKTFKKEQVTVGSKALVHIACDYSDVNIVRLLSDKGADFTQEDKTGSTCIHIAAGSKFDALAKVNMVCYL